MTLRSWLLLGTTLQLLLSGCVSVDSRTWQEKPAPGGTSNLQGRFSCSADYVSHKFGFEGPPTLSDVFDTEKCESATLYFTKEPTLIVSFERSGVMSEPKTIDQRSGLRLIDPGKVMLTKKIGCGGGMGFGCDKGSMTLFVNEAGDLVVVQSSGGAGMFLLPIAMYAKLMAIFPRKER
jgi:hypothetical protein